MSSQMMSKIEARMEVMGRQSMFVATDQKECPRAVDFDKQIILQSIHSSLLLKIVLPIHLSLTFITCLFATSSMLRNNSSLAFDRSSYWWHFLFSALTLIFLWFALILMYSKRLDNTSLLVCLMLSGLVFVVDFGSFTRFLFVILPMLKKSKRIPDATDV